MKKVMLGIIIGSLLATAVPAAAEEINKRVTATLRADYTLEVDGNKVELENPPLVYNGKAHLPLREAADLLGKEVDFVDGVIKLETPIADPVAELKRLEGNIKMLEENLVIINQTLSEAENEEQIEQINHSIKVTQDAIVFNENKISSLLERYPELAEQASE